MNEIIFRRKFASSFCACRIFVLPNINKLKASFVKIK